MAQKHRAIDDSFPRRMATRLQRLCFHRKDAQNTKKKAWCTRSLLRNSQAAPTIALVAVLALAAALRLWNLSATEFKFDEARVANLAAHFVDSGIPPLRGMGSSTGIDNPPLAVYLMSVPALVSRDPLIATAFVALLNVAAVWGCYALGKRY